MTKEEIERAMTNCKNDIELALVDIKWLKEKIEVEENYIKKRKKDFEQLEWIKMHGCYDRP